MIALYDPADVISRILSNYFPDVQKKSIEGILDPVDPSLVGRVRLPHNVPEGCPLATAIRLVGDPKSLVDFITSPRQHCTKFLPSSRTHVRFVDELLASGLAVKRSRDTPEKGFAKFFTVEKKVADDGTPVLRTILDCRSANEVFMDPLPVNLPTLPQLLEAFGTVEEIRALDLRHWYHQIPVHTELSKWFTIAFGSLRLQWKVMPMGWKWACFVAQALSTYAAAGNLAFTWTELPPVFYVDGVAFAVVYDNIIAGGPAKAVERVWTQLLSRLNDINAVVKEQFSASHGSSLPALGIEWEPNTVGLRWRLLEKFGKKAVVVADTLHGMVPAKAIAGAIGIVAWSRFATQKALYDLQPLYRRLSAAVAAFGWGVKDTVEEYKGLTELLRSIPTLGWQSKVSPIQEVLVFSDAHVTGYGCVGGDPVCSTRGVWDRRHQSGDMFFLEAIAAKQAVKTFLAPKRRIFLAVDNKALMFAIKKRSSACPRSAPILADIMALSDAHEVVVTPGWIPTDRNPADPLSRGNELDPSLLCDAQEHVQWTSPPCSQWGSKWGRVVG